MRPPSVTTMIWTECENQLSMISRKRPQWLKLSKYMPSDCLRVECFQHQSGIAAEEGGNQSAFIALDKASFGAALRPCGITLLSRLPYNVSVLSDQQSGH